MDIDDLDAEFGASPLGKSGGKAVPPPQAQPSTIVPQSLNFDDSSLPGGVIAAIALPPSLDPGQLDLYGDLYGGNGKGKTLLETQVAQLSDQCSKQEKLIKELQARVMTLDATNSELSEANTNLTHNISSLFNTAKLEIERKDNEIKELREKIAQIEQRSSSARAQQDSRTPSDRQQPQHAQQPYHGQREDRSHSRGRDKDRGQRSDRDRDLKKEHDPREERPRHGSMDRRGSGHGGTREERSSERERDMRRGR